MYKIWIAPGPLLLASTSALRARILRRAGLLAKPVAPTVEERDLQARLNARGETPAGVALQLSQAKACEVSALYPGAYVLGFDQTLEFENACLSKPGSTEELRARLMMLSGQRHQLHSGFAIAQGGAVMDAGVASAFVQFRSFSEEFADAYVKMAGPSGLTTVGGYQFEGLGVNMFEEVDGDYFTLVGTPLLQLLRSLRTLGLIVT